jgi:hypothetical protein
MKGRVKERVRIVMEQDGQLINGRERCWKSSQRWRELSFAFNRSVCYPRLTGVNEECLLFQLQVK